MKYLALSLLTFACATAEKNMASPVLAEEAYFDGAMEADSVATGGSRIRVSQLAEKVAPAADEIATDAQPASRMVIYTASMSVRVANAAAAIDSFVTAIDKSGGYLASRRDNSVTVRVPAARFHDVIALLDGYGSVTARDIRSQDVTAQFRDITIRLETATAARERLLKLLETAVKTEDLLKIEAELRRLTQEIELLKGQLRSLGDQVALSTITVHFADDAPEAPRASLRKESRFGWINRVGVHHAISNF